MPGSARSARCWGAGAEGDAPAATTLAKRVPSGSAPRAAGTGSESTARHFDDNVLWVGSTYSGHPLACAAGAASIEAYRDDGLIERSARMGEKLLADLRKLADRHPSIGDVRGRGLFVGIELGKDRRAQEMLE